VWNVCQTAGGYGGAHDDNRPPPAVTLVSTSVRADADGYVPVTLKCHLPQAQCMGVLLVTLRAYLGHVDEFYGKPYEEPVDGGRSDLLVNAGATRTIAVPALHAAGLAYLRSHGPTPFNLTIDAGQAPGCQDRHDNCGPTNNNFSYVFLDNPMTVAPPG
jgi:hypothetical protein